MPVSPEFSLSMFPHDNETVQWLADTGKVQNLIHIPDNDWKDARKQKLLIPLTSFILLLYFGQFIL